MTTLPTMTPIPELAPKRFWPTVGTIVFVVVVTLAIVGRPMWEKLFNDLSPDTQQPVEFTSHLYGFGATYPREPTIEPTTEALLGIDVEITTVMAESSSETYAVSAVESTGLGIPDPATLSAADVDLLLKSSLDGAVANMRDGVILDYDYGQVGGTRSIVADIETAAGLASFAVVIVSDRYYIILASSEDDKDESAFIESFELVS